MNAAVVVAVLQQQTDRILGHGIRLPVLPMV
jgi:hypothetical protein